MKELVLDWWQVRRERCPYLPNVAMGSENERSFGQAKLVRATNWLTDIM